MEIDGYTTIIQSDNVRNRISDLEEDRPYDVIRLRDNGVIESFDVYYEAQSFIEDEDYNVTRVAVRMQELDDEDAEELSSLRSLVDQVAVSGDWTLYNESYFDVEWARDEAAEKLSVSRYTLDEWPLSQIDWDEAATELRDDRYNYTYGFDNTTFYGDE